ncbi:MAG TPA: hypothetical protein VK582_03140 [Pyrinomonadaceae bacterium]|nr:hypothetical protein [Pyrinomonadaceae bacterium]
MISEDFNIIAFRNAVKDLSSDEQIWEARAEYTEADKRRPKEKYKRDKQTQYMRDLLAYIHDLLNPEKSADN